MVKSAERTVTVGKAPTELTIEVSPVSGPPTTVSIKGTLKSDSKRLGNRTVALYVNGVVKAETTTNNAKHPTYNYWFEYDVGEGTYTFYTSFGGDGVYAPSDSDPVTGDYSKIDTDLSIDVTPDSGVAPLDVDISGRLTRTDTDAGLGDKTVNLYVNDTKVDDMKTKSSTPGIGSYLFDDYSLVDSGTYNFYVEFEGDDTYAGCEEMILPCPGCGGLTSVDEDHMGPGSSLVCSMCGSHLELVKL